MPSPGSKCRPEEELLPGPGGGGTAGEGTEDPTTPLTLFERQTTTSRTRSRAGSSSEHGEATVLSSVISLSAWAMGCGVLALPRAFALCGPGWSLVFLLTFSFWVNLSLRWVVACGRYSGKRGFRENAQFFLGVRAGRVVHCGQVMLLCGGIVAVFVTAASLLGCSAKELLECLCVEEDVSDASALPSQAPLRRICRTAHPAPCMPRNRVLMLVASLVFPLACQRSLHSLTWISSLSLGCLVYFFLVLVARLALATAAAVASEQYTAPEAAPGPFWQGPPVVLMSLLCHTSILQLDAELRPEARSSVGLVISTVILRIALPVYALVGLGGLWLHGPGVSPNVLEDFTGDAWMAAARLMLGFMNVAKLSTATVTLREALVSSLPVPKLRRRLRELGGRAVSAAAILAAGACTASAMGSLSRVLSLLGCTVGVSFSFCLPSLLYARLLRDVAAKRRRAAVAAGAGGDLVQPLLGASEPVELACVAGVLALPETRAGWIFHWSACISVFVGSLCIGCLGLASWLSGPAS